MEEEEAAAASEKESAAATEKEAAAATEKEAHDMDFEALKEKLKRKKKVSHVIIFCHCGFFLNFFFGGGGHIKLHFLC